MAKQDRSAFKAGLFIVISTVLIGFVLVAIKGIHTVFVPSSEHKAAFTLTDDIGGLRLGDDVRIGGFKVGVIRDIELEGLASGEKPRILISFDLPDVYPLHDNTHVAVQGTLTGGSWLNIDDLGSGKLLAEGEILTGHPSAFGSVLSSLSDSGPELAALLRDVHTITVPKVNAAVDKASDTLASLHDLLGDVKGDLKGTIAHLNSITGTAQAKLPGLLDHLDAVASKLVTTIDNAQTTLADIKGAAANARDFTASARDIIAGNHGKLDTIIASLKITSDNLKGASAEIRRSPWRLLYKPEAGEMANLNLFDATRQFAEGASSLDDATLALRDALKNPNSDPKDIQKLINQLDQSFANFNLVEHKLWDSVKVDP
jgi:ABC-type transporter Mla subunit MlaD